MKWLAAGLTFVNAATISALMGGMIGHGLNRGIAVGSVILGLIATFFAFRGANASTSSEMAQPPVIPGGSIRAAFARYRIWVWFMAGIFALFAFRSYLFLFYIDNNEYKIQSPFNLGDLSLHLAYIKNFASGVPLWPDNPIYVFSKLRYPAGTDLFNAILLCVGMDLPRGLAWAGILSCAGTCFAFYRWGGCFGIAGFLFNGGLVGLQFLRTSTFVDYQDVNTIAWKSIPLTMMVTQRGLLYALPAGLLLLYHWRAKFYRRPLDSKPPSSAQKAAPSKPPSSPQGATVPKPALSSAQGPVVSEPPLSSSPPAGSETAASAVPEWKPPLPFWLELSLYATMPLFHAHTFLALSIVLAVLFLFGTSGARKHIAKLLALAFVPAAFIAWLITDHFHAGSVIAFQPGWVQSDGEFARPLSHSTKNFGILNPLINFLEFWIVNFGFWMPIVLAMMAAIFLRVFGKKAERGPRLPESVVFVLAATSIFLLAFFVKTAPWGWDNMKIIVWAYFIILPFLWSELLGRWPFTLRAVVYLALFASGFVSLIGGLKVGRPGFGLADRAEVDAVEAATRKLPAVARYAAYPTFNHPLLLSGRKVILGYPGHLWTQGFETSADHAKLGTLMRGEGDWKATARFFQTRYMFWGREEARNYPQSGRHWENECKLVASGSWGAIYDLQTPK